MKSVPFSDLEIGDEFLVPVGLMPNGKDIAYHTAIKVSSDRFYVTETDRFWTTATCAWMQIDDKD